MDTDHEFNLSANDLKKITDYRTAHNWVWEGSPVRWIVVKIIVAGTVYRAVSTYLFQAANSLNFLICYPAPPILSNLYRVCIRQSDGLAYIKKIG